MKHMKEIIESNPASMTAIGYRRFPIGGGSQRALGLRVGKDPGVIYWIAADGAVIAEQSEADAQAMLEADRRAAIRRVNLDESLKSDVLILVEYLLDEIDHMAEVERAGVDTSDHIAQSVLRLAHAFGRAQSEAAN